MYLTTDYVAELEILCQFNLDAMDEGLKIHKEANPSIIQAAKRLFDKGLITHQDGGYLTDRGVESAQKIQGVLNILKLG